MNIKEELMYQPELFEVAKLLFQQSTLFQLYSALQEPEGQVQWEYDANIKFNTRNVYIKIIENDLGFPKRFGFNTKAMRGLSYWLIHPKLRKYSPLDEWINVFFEYTARDYAKNAHPVMKLYEFVENGDREMVKWSKDGTAILVKDVDLLKQLLIKNYEQRKNQKMVLRSLKILLSHFYFQHQMSEQGECRIKHTFLTKNSSMNMWILPILMRREQISHIWTDDKTEKSKKKSVVNRNIKKQPKQTPAPAKTIKKEQQQKSLKSSFSSGQQNSSKQFQIGSLSSNDMKLSDNQNNENQSKKPEQGGQQDKILKKSQVKYKDKFSIEQKSRIIAQTFWSICQRIMDLTDCLYDEVNKVKTKWGLVQLRTFARLSIVCSEITLHTDQHIARKRSKLSII